jgi:signal transduction histidine kinase
MKNVPRQFSLVLLLNGFFLVLLFFGAYHVKNKATIDASFSQNGPYLEVRHVGRSSPGMDLGPEDILLAVNDHPVKNIEALEFILDGLFSGDIAELTVMRENEIISVYAVLTPYYTPAYIVIMLIVGGLYFIMGVFVRIRRPDEKGARVFYFATLSVAAIIMMTWGNYAIEPFGAGVALRILFSVAYAFAPALFLHFTFVFPRNKLTDTHAVLIPLYGIATLLSVAMAVMFIRAALPVSMEWADRYLLVFDITRAFFSLCLIGGVINVYHSYKHAREELERRKLRWIMLGLSVAPAAFVLLWQMPSLFFQGGVIAEEILLVIMSIIPVTFGISIVRYHTFDIDLIFKRTTAYALVFSVVLFIYIVFIGSVAAILDTLTVSSSLIVSAGAAVIIALLFEPLRRTIFRFVDKTFFRVQYDYRQAVRLLSEEIRKRPNAAMLAKSVINRLYDLLQVDRIAFCLRNDEFKNYRISAHKGFADIPPDILAHLGSYIQTSPDIPIAPEDALEPGIRFNPGQPGLFDTLGIKLIVPVVSESGLLNGCLLVGKKRAEVRFSIEDIDLLTNVATQSSVALDRITLQERLLLEHAETRRLEELNQMKSYFVSSVSHELKTPLTSIRMFAEMLLQDQKKPDQQMREYLEIIEGESERLKRLIDNVLDYSKIERGIKEYHFGYTGVNDTVNSVVKLFKYQFMINGFKVRLKLSRNDIMLYADRDALVEALINLLNNAMKYSSDIKEIAIHTARKNGSAHIAISDKGIGISPDAIPHLFDPFYRGIDKTTQNITGAGLGLSIVHHIVTSHKGEITIQSEPGKGSTFTIILPILHERKPVRSRSRGK